MSQEYVLIVLKDGTSEEFESADYCGPEDGMFQVIVGDTTHWWPASDIASVVSYPRYEE